LNELQKPDDRGRLFFIRNGGYDLGDAHERINNTFKGVCLLIFELCPGLLRSYRKSDFVPLIQVNEKKQPQHLLKQAYHAAVLFISMDEKGDCPAENSATPSSVNPYLRSGTETNRPKSIPDAKPPHIRQTHAAPRPASPHSQPKPTPSHAPQPNRSNAKPPLPSMSFPRGTKPMPPPKVRWIFRPLAFTLADGGRNRRQQEAAPPPLPGSTFTIKINAVHFGTPNERWSLIGQGRMRYAPTKLCLNERYCD
jgi:hypothetical protein